MGSGPEEVFFEFLRQGKFMLQRCRRSGECVFYPRVLTRDSGSSELEWVEAQGTGNVYSSTVVRRKPEHGGNYNIAIVQLAEGPRMMTRVLGIDPADVRIGMKVTARIEAPSWDRAANAPVVVFYPG